MAADLVALLSAKEMVLVCGSGGVGKTTTAAAMGVAAAVNTKGRVLVLTIDPARRLADALGIGALGNEATRVPDDAFADAGVEPRGELWAAMLDTKAGWDELIRRHAPDAKVRESVLANPLYQNITSRFVHSHDYLAMERLHELHTSGEYDLIIVDTPPSRNAIAFLDAPGRMKEFFGSKLLKWLTVPYRSRLFTMASKPFYQVADRVLGSRFLQDIAEFFILFQAMERGFVRHATEVEKILSDPRTTFVVVSTLEAAPTHEATYLARALGRRDLHLGAIVANRVLPKSFTTKSAKTAARKLVKRSGEIADLLALDADPDAVADVVGEMGRRFDDVAVVAKRETERQSELSSMASLLVPVPVLDRDVDDLADLVELTRSFGS
ncbi:MAG: AAA family ATPase [Ilumatobacter sp.]|nr:AAA family ATPase [Ilumatobacter sp.]